MLKFEFPKHPMFGYYTLWYFTLGYFRQGYFLILLGYFRLFHLMLL
jgi:hypothetical protein